MEQITSPTPTETTQVTQTTQGEVSTVLPRTDMQKIEDLLTDQQKKIDVMYTTLEKMKKHNTITMWLTIIFVVLPIALSAFALPYLAKTYMGTVSEDMPQGIDMQALLKQVQNSQNGKATSE